MIGRKEQLKEIGKAVVEGLTVAVGFGMLTVLYFVMGSNGGMFYIAA